MLSENQDNIISENTSSRGGDFDVRVIICDLSPSLHLFHTSLIFPLFSHQSILISLSLPTSLFLLASPLPPHLDLSFLLFSEYGNGDY